MSTTRMAKDPGLSSIEKRLSEAISKKVRSNTSQNDSGSAESAQGAQKSVSVREAQFSDFESVCALNLKLGQGPDSPANWRRLWSENPALADGARISRIGWVLETAGGEIVGFLGCIPLTYELEDKKLRVAATCRFAVDAAYRAFSHLLVVSFFRQKDVDLFLNTTATPAAAKIVKALNAVPVPQADYGKVLFWVLNKRRFAEELLKKIGVWPPSAAPGSLLGALALEANSLFRRWPHSQNSKFSVKFSSIEELGTQIDCFLAKKKKEKSLLLAERSPGVLSWHFNPPGNRRATVVPTCWSGSELLGYMIVRMDPAAFSGLRRALVADIQIKGDDADVLGCLLEAGLSAARKNGCDVFEIIGFPDSIRKGAAQWKPYSRDYPECPFWYKARSGELQRALAKSEFWYASPFDGDGSLWP